MHTEQLLKRAKQLCEETMNARFKLSPISNEGWLLYMYHSLTSYKGELDEVLKIYIDEIESYRKPAGNIKHVKGNKPFIY